MVAVYSGDWMDDENRLSSPDIWPLRKQCIIRAGAGNSCRTSRVKYAWKHLPHRLSFRSLAIIFAALLTARSLELVPRYTITT